MCIKKIGVKSNEKSNFYMWKINISRSCTWRLASAIFSIWDAFSLAIAASSSALPNSSAFFSFSSASTSCSYKISISLLDGKNSFKRVGKCCQHQIAPFPRAPSYVLLLIFLEVISKLQWLLLFPFSVPNEVDHH